MKAASRTGSMVGSYLNYIDPYLDNWQELYYRDHWDRLREIKSQWDPTWYFRFPQGIPPKNRQPDTLSKGIMIVPTFINFMLVILAVFSSCNYK